MLTHLCAIQHYLQAIVCFDICVWGTVSDGFQELPFFKRKGKYILKYSLLFKAASLKDNSKVGMVDKRQYIIAMHGVSYFCHYFSPFPCEITYSNGQFVENDVMKVKRICVF